ncbi:dynamin family protein [Dialister invisus]|uniref:dynamin family protein n=1 Tax=Dialister invisus TaxID=218538 RepID=UPI003993BF94
MITSYKKAKEDVLQYYTEFLDVVGKLEISENDISLKALKLQADKIREDKFCLMIAGEAKSGKSTFINAYLGTEILPMDVRQCTSSVVEIRYGNEFVLNATYADDRTKKISGEEEITAFLTTNAALDDEYRDIPITTINNEIIVKYQDKKILEAVIVDLLKGVERENIHRLSIEEYNKKIREYIKRKQPHWRDVVVKIDIEYPFEDKNMRGVRIIDSPGVNAAGKVGDVTAAYIESADAIMFLRPITGVAIEANSFKEFLESKSVDRNKNAMFLILTRAAAESDETIERAYEEFVNMFGTQKNDNRHGIVKEQIIPVDSKVELYYNAFQTMSTEEIKAEIKKMNAEKKIEPFLKAAWFDADGEKEAFLAELKRISNFNVIDQSLNRFGRKAQFIALSEFLGRMLKVYTKIGISLHEKIANYELKAEDPGKLAVKIKQTEAELINIENRMNEKVDDISAKYAGSGKKGLITQRAEEIMADYKKKIEAIKDTSDSSLEELEKLSFRQIDTFIDFEATLQKNVIAECNEALRVELSGNNTVEYVSLEPDFSKEVVEKIKKDMKSEANESYTYTTGLTFKDTHIGSRFSQDKYYKRIKDNINERLDSIKQQAIRDLRSFVSHTVTAYTKELAKNADAKKTELRKIRDDKKTAEEIALVIKDLKALLDSLGPKKRNVTELKGGIDGNV